MGITYLDDAPKITYLDDEKPKSVGDFAQNAITDTKANIAGMLQNAKAGGLAHGFDILRGKFDPVTAYETGRGLAALPGHVADEIRHPIESMYKTPISTGLDFATIADAGATGVKSLQPWMGDTAVGLESRALGAQKRFRMTPFSRGKVAQASEVSLENKFFPALGSPEVAEQNATAFKNKIGGQIEGMRASVGNKPVLEAIQPAVDNLERLREQMTKGSRGGKWDAIHKKIDAAQSTLLGLADRGDSVSLNDIAEARKTLADALPWDSMSKALEKKINGSIESGLEKVLSDSGGDVGAYRALKRKYGGAKDALKYLSNEVARQGGNIFPDLPSMAAGGIAAASGEGLAKSGIVATLWEAARHRGPAIAANALHGLSKSRIPAINPLVFALLQAGKQSGQP
jgi:hypothetical protein